MACMERTVSAVYNGHVGLLVTRLGLSDRLVLVILDRNVDLIPMLSHSWTYQALVHDVLDMKLNRVTVEVSWESFCAAAQPSQLTPQSPENGRLQKKSYDIDSKDFFWAKNGGNPFPQVAEDIDTELNR